MAYLKAPLLPSSATVDCKAQHQNWCFMFCYYQLIALFANPSSNGRHIRDCRLVASPEMEVKLTGLLFPASSFLAFLLIRVTFAFLQSSGTSPQREPILLILWSPPVTPPQAAAWWPGLSVTPSQGWWLLPSLPATLNLKLSSWQTALWHVTPKLEVVNGGTDPGEAPSKKAAGLRHGPWSGRSKPSSRTPHPPCSGGNKSQNGPEWGKDLLK